MAALTTSRCRSALESAECHMHSSLRRAVGGEVAAIRHDLDTIQRIRQGLSSVGDLTVIDHVDTSKNAGPKSILVSPHA